MELRKRQGWGLVQTEDVADGAIGDDQISDIDGSKIVAGSIPGSALEPGAVDAVAPSYTAGGTFGARTASFGTIATVSASVSLATGKKMFMILSVTARGRITKTKTRLAQFQVRIGSTPVGTLNISFISTKLTTRAGTLIFSYTATANLSGALTIVGRETSTQLVVSNGTYQFFAAIPDSA